LIIALFYYSQAHLKWSETKQLSCLNFSSPLFYCLFLPAVHTTVIKSAQSLNTLELSTEP
jgi:hypothetical protein